MTIRPRPRVLLGSAAALLLGIALAGVERPTTAQADGWTDMRAEFREAMKAEDWHQRRDAFIYIADHNRAETVQEILSALAKESNAAVLLAGVETLGGQTSSGSREILFKVARKGKGRERLLVLNALGTQKGKDVTDLLVEISSGRDGPAAAQAALALRKEKSPEAIPPLLKLLKHKDWQVRRAAAGTLADYGAKEAVPPLASALVAAKGRDRCDLIAALEKLTGHGYGNDPAAWRKLARGDDPEEIRAKPKLAPTAFGIPIYGQRVVICLDNSLRMTDPHPFDGERLRKLCDPLDGDPIPWFRMKMNGQFAHGHVKHLIKGFPKGSKFELITFNAIVRDVFGGLANVGAASRNTAIQAMESLITDDGIATYEALNRALDIAGPKTSTAWKSGPDEILFITVNMPTAGEIKEADLVAAAIGLKARLRMVPIHTVGIHFHPYDMCRAIAEKTGGVYVNLTE